MSGALAHSVVGRPLRADDLGAELPTFRFRVRRDADLLSLDFRFVNFERREDTLHALGSGQSRVIVRFPPQNLAEARFDKAAIDVPVKPGAKDPPKLAAPVTADWEERPIPPAASGKPAYSPEPPVATYLSGPSWVAFDVPDGTTLPLSRAAAGRNCGPCDASASPASWTVVDLWLDMMGGWKIRIPSRTQTPLKPEMPADDETCLEVPFRLFLTPRTETAKWVTSSTPPLGPGPRAPAVEHWHAALHDRTKLKPASLPPDIPNVPPELAPPKNVTFQARAAFSPDYQDVGEPPWARFYPGNLPLSHRATARHSLVKQMSDGPGDGWIDAEHLILAPLGADASLSYMMQKTFREILDAQLDNKDTDKSARLAIWKHRMVVGRDTFLLSAWTGFLMPLVIPALFVELTRRKFASRLLKAPVGNPDPSKDPFGPPGAYLVTEYFVFAPDPVKQFPEPLNVLGRKMPVRKATLLDPRSPLLRLPSGADPLKEPFVPERLDGGAKVRWPIEFEDVTGGTSRTDDACLLFAANVVKGHDVWEAQTPEVRRWSMPASRLALAPDSATLQAPPSMAGAKPAVHTLAREERDAAAKLAAECQAFLGGGGPEADAKVKQIKDALQTLSDPNAPLPPPVRAQADRLKADSRAFMATLVHGLESDKHQAQEMGSLLLGQLAAGERLVGTTTDVALKNVKDAASRLGKAVQMKVAAGEVSADYLIKVLTGDAGAVADLPPDAQNALKALDPVKPEVTKVIQELQATQVVAQRVVESALRQLARAERAATDVEVHAIEFGSRRVDGLLKKAAEIRDRLDTFAKRQDFEAWVAGLTDIDAKEQARLRNELGALWGGLVGGWDAQKEEAREFFDGLAVEGAKARTFLRDGFQPHIVSADVIVPALKAMGGTAPPQELKLLEDYAAKGIDKVRNSAFAGFTKAVDDGKAMADRIKCAVAAPAAQVAGLSRDLGAMVGSGKDAVDQLARQADGFDLRGAIPDFKLLGVLPFDKIVSAALSGAELPTINVVNVPDHVEQIWEWNARLQKIDLGILGFEPRPQPRTKTGQALAARTEPVHLSITMRTRIDLPKPGQPSAAAARGKVTLKGLISYWDKAAKKPVTFEDDTPYNAFAISILQLININFIDLHFDAQYDVGATPDFKVRPRLGEVVFLPPLDFVKKLQDALPILGKGFDVVQEAARIGITYQFQLPGIAFGVFSMRNLSIGSAVMFSLEGKPLRFDFNISTWKEPFELTVLCFGGRGFLKVAADTGGYRDLQGMLEFGGALSFDVVVASGGLYVMAGIYFRITTERTTVAGFLRAGGTLNVLGLIHASVEFLLMLSYVSGGGKPTKLAGEASITVSIDLFLVSFDVTVRMYKEFEGSGENDNTTAMAFGFDRGRTMRLVSSNGVAAAPAPRPPARLPDAPPAYFTRQGFPETGIVAGRFHDDYTWYEQYWSQFAL